jgi:hypothetical protein
MMVVSEKIKDIKYSRLKKHEKWFINLLDGSIKTIYEEHPDSIFWIYEGFTIFEYKITNNYLFFNTTFYNYLSDYLKTDIEIKEYVTNTVSNYFLIEIEKVFPLHLDFFFKQQK